MADMIAYEAIIEAIREKTKLDKSTIEQKIQAKQDEFSGLISQEGAAHIVANELGVNMLEQLQKPVLIEQIKPPMRRIYLKARVLQKYELVEFEKESRSGKVQSLLLGDSTGTIRFTCWHADVQKLEAIDPDDTISIENAISRENQGRVELHATPDTTIKKIDETIEVKLFSPQSQDAPVSTLAQVEQKTGMVTVHGVIVQMNPLAFYYVDPQTNKKIKEDQIDANVHQKACLCSVLIDDGTHTMRVVFFRDVCAQLFETSIEQLYQAKEAGELEALQKPVFGKMIQVRARINENNLSQAKELIALSVEEYTWEHHENNLKS
ncbi:MAG: hypothetical protein ACMXYF_00205 [Candidatus Woesearchaeota archaeon]